MSLGSRMDSEGIGQTPDVRSPKTPKTRSKMMLKALNRARARGFGRRFRFILSGENQWIVKAKQLEY